MIRNKRIIKSLDRIESKIGGLTKELNRVKGRIDAIVGQMNKKPAKKGK